MPNKYPLKKGWNVPKQKYKLTNWAEYNAALCRRGEIDVWLSEEAIAQWYEPSRIYDGTGLSSSPPPSARVYQLSVSDNECTTQLPKLQLFKQAITRAWHQGSKV